MAYLSQWWLKNKVCWQLWHICGKCCACWLCASECLLLDISYPEIRLCLPCLALEIYHKYTLLLCAPYIAQRRNCRTGINQGQFSKDQRIRQWKRHLSMLNGLRVIKRTTWLMDQSGHKWAGTVAWRDLWWPLSGLTDLWILMLPSALGSL